MQLFYKKFINPKSWFTARKNNHRCRITLHCFQNVIISHQHPLIMLCITKRASKITS
ncbi:hypothetical protein EVA_03974 [gut metagenome]|uniref:Uncharacterized protein n=1 Tax=gut metagenome TaxID=749906 RepID=J9H2X0_9ZZZZ